MVEVWKLGLVNGVGGIGGGMNALGRYWKVLTTDVIILEAQGHDRAFARFGRTLFVQSPTISAIQLQWACAEALSLCLSKVLLVDRHSMPRFSLLIHVANKVLRILSWLM